MGVRETIIVIGLSNLGDAILTLPAMAAVRAAHPQARITLVTSPRAAGLFDGDPRWDQVVVYDGGGSWREKWRLIQRLRREGVDQVIDFRNGLWAWLLQPWRWHPVHWPKTDQHRTRMHLARARHHGIVEGDGRPLVWCAPEDERQADQWVAGARDLRIAIAPGARSHLKRWTASGYAEVINRLSSQHDAAIFVIGDQEDRAVVEEIQRDLQHPVINLCGQTTLRQLAALLQRCHLVITNDSAPLHLACAVGTPVVAIFGPTDERKYGPSHASDRVVRKSLHCTPCETALCRYRHECMRWLSVDEVMHTVEEALSCAS